MFEIIVMDGKQIVSREKFVNQDCAWAFFEMNKKKGFVVEFWSKPISAD